ncbi:Metallo-dependent phosphatase-like protein [Roridomyces roridus]|uniref:Metallo-dependent phosphatase-like protein n=1 Tax=Roridomyces roridus TaxID=1738132 RepID=A0AAD7CEX9_9AGAR|nr:Metallo-dependent phosphatase-like protein [Roridomyces roridus]
MTALNNRLAVNGLRLVWTVLAIWKANYVAWYEHVVFLRAVRQCVWPDHPQPVNDASFATHILIVADPQIIDHRSYPGRGATLTYVSQLLVDLNLRKSWRAALALDPDVVVFLGDMMDGGRFSMEDDEYERYYRRFKSIFPLDSKIPQYFIPGNHDTGLGVSTQFSEKAAARYISHFGPLNNRVSIANHSLVFLDAPGLADTEHRQSTPGEPIEFVRSVAKLQDPSPVVLFTHIPLSRPDGANCGPLRERGTIRRGTGFGYQNTLEGPASAFLLQSLNPSIIFSGDDHDYCEYIHAYTSQGKSRQAREVTVKSLSIYFRFFPPQALVPGSATHADSLCLLPDQLGIYLETYIPLLVLSIVLICLSNLRRTCFSRQARRHYDSPSSSNSPSYSPLTGDLRSRNDSRGYRSENDDVAEGLPHPTPSVSRKGSRPSVFADLRSFRASPTGDDWVGIHGSTCRVHFQLFRKPATTKSRGFIAGCLYDIRDTAAFPLTVFLVLSLWMFR